MLAGTPASVVVSSVAEGDLGPGSREPRAVVEARRQQLVPGRWRWARQVHGRSVVVLEPEQPCEGLEADALVTTGPGAPLAAFAADCGLIGLSSAEGAAAVVHAGWRGLLAGVVEETAAAMRRVGASTLSGVLGPCIGAECYAFGAVELEVLERRFGPSVRAVTATGEPALDLRAALHRALEEAGVSGATEIGGCTSCDPGWYSWRARRDTARHALVVSTAS